MTTLEVLLFILFIVVIVTAIAESINIPYPILLVIAGLLVGIFPHIPKWQPSSDIILPLFLPPILFSAARTVSWHEIKHNLISIFSLAFALVFITAITIALILNLTVESMDLDTAFLLGAIIAPTDIIAAQSILSKMHVKNSVIKIIHVESLFNDAVGILMYKTAFLLIFIHAGLPHIHNSWHPGMLFVGIFIGVCFAHFTHVIIKHFLKESENDLPIIMGIILAYVSFLFAEKIGASSVFSTIAAGLYYKKTTHLMRATTRLAEWVVWDTLLFFLNGFIFILIGIEFPDYLHKIHYLPLYNIVLFSIITLTTLIILRFFWVSLTDYLNQFWRQRNNLRNRVIKLQWKDNIVITWSGMRGLVSMALALALPEKLANGRSFPERNLIIVLTIITLLFTLIVQGLSLPWIIQCLKIKTIKNSLSHQVREIYKKLTKLALTNIEMFSHHPETHSVKAKELVETHYSNRLLGLHIRPNNHEEHEKHQIDQMEAELLLARSLQFERDMLLKMRQQGEITEEVYIKVLQKLDRDEVNFLPH